MTVDVGRAERLRLGIFVAGALGLLALALFYLVGKRLFTRHDDYFARFEESVDGLELGGPVKLNGVEIGTVGEISIDPQDVRKAVVKFRVIHGTTMKKDMVATLGNYGITGLKFLEISGGSYAAPDIPPGGEVKSGLSTLGRLTARADSIASKVDQLLGNVVALTGGQNREALDRLVRSSSDLSNTLDTLVKGINRLGLDRRLGQALDEYQGVARDLRAKVRQVDAAALNRQVGDVAANVNGVAQRANVTVLRVQEDLTQAMADLRETMRNMNYFSREIRENPAVLLRGEEKKERHR